MVKKDYVSNGLKFYEKEYLVEKEIIDIIDWCEPGIGIGSSASDDSLRP